MSNNDHSHLHFLQDTSEILAALTGSRDLDGFLTRLVKLVARHLDADVCSIYLLEAGSTELVLRATTGLNADAIGNIRLQVGEGLVGTALKELRPICESCASQHPAFRYFPGTDEERYEAFLAVPIMRGIEKVGVLVVQRERSRAFVPEDVAALRVVTAQLAGTVEQARALMLADSGAQEVPARSREPLPPFLRGEPGAPGCAAGKALRYDRRFSLTQEVLPEQTEDRSADGQTLIKEAIERTELQLRRMQEELGQRLPEAAALIFEAHLMMLHDRSFVEGMYARVADGSSAAGAVVEVARSYMQRFQRSTHDYLREKAQDVEDLALRLIANLAAAENADTLPLAGRIVIARDVLPSDMLKLALENVAGVVLTAGGVTSHVAILARSLGVPMIIAHNPRLGEICDGTDLMLDADAGNIYINPSDEVTERYRQREKVRAAAESAAEVKPETFTSDGQRIHLFANINLLSELELALRMQCEGVGLYRSEFPFLIRTSLPDAAEQRAIYARLLERMDNRPVTIRTLDAGGDKMLSFFDEAGEENPELGLRSVRFTLRHIDIMEQQLQAILEAGAESRVQLGIMFPMVSSLDEFRRARDICLRISRQMEAVHDVQWPPAIGMMIELPAVLETLDAFVAEADFFSIGTNDFVQYMLAVDRTNARVASYYCPHHPSVLRALARAIGIIDKAGKPVTVCGEMAHDMRYVPFFIGAGLRRLSVDPHWLPELQAGIARWSTAQCRDYAAALLSRNTIEETAELLCSEPGNETNK